MYKAGPARRETHAQLTGELRMGTRCHPRELFVRDLDELDPVAGPSERAQHSVDAIAGKAVDAANAPRRQPLHDRVAHRQRRRFAFRAVLAPSILLHPRLVSTDVLHRARVWSTIHSEAPRMRQVWIRPERLLFAEDAGPV